MSCIYTVIQSIMLVTAFLILFILFNLVKIKLEAIKFVAIYHCLLRNLYSLLIHLVSVFFFVLLFQFILQMINFKLHHFHHLLSFLLTFFNFSFFHSNYFLILFLHHLHFLLDSFLLFPNLLHFLLQLQYLPFLVLDLLISSLQLII
jgi:hypothetical protein